MAMSVLHALVLWASGLGAAPDFQSTGAAVQAEESVFGKEIPQLRLNFPANRFDRRTLPNGDEIIRFDGSITNIGKRTLKVPPLQLVLKDADERIVYSVIIPAPRASLRAGRSVKVSQAYLGIPKAAKIAEIGWKPAS